VALGARLVFLVAVLRGATVFAADPIRTDEAVVSEDRNRFSQRFALGKGVVVVEIRTQPFKRTTHRLTLDESGGVRKVDGRRALGTDAGPPEYLKSEITSIAVVWNGTRRPIDRRFFADCFNTSAIPARVLVSDDFQSVMITLSGGDGAGHYEVTWTASSDGLVRRFLAQAGDF
jgi:hypothetical protein